MLSSTDKGSTSFNPKFYDIDVRLSRARQRWEKVCKDLQLPPKWKTITGNFSHRSVPAIFRAMAILKETRNPEARPVPVKLQVAKQKSKPLLYRMIWRCGNLT